MEVSTSTQDVGIQTSPTGTSEIMLRKRIRNLQQKLRRKVVSINNLKDLVKYLKDNNKSCNTLEDVLQANFNDFAIDLFKNEWQNGKSATKRRTYSDEMKKFAMTLYFYSPKAFNFVREKLFLPNSSTIRKWLSTRNCDVGFLSEVFEFLKKEVFAQPYLKEVSLVFDSMSIRSQLIYDVKNGKQCGYVDFGGISLDAGEELATEALVLLVVSYTKSFKCPIAYFYTNKMPAALQSQIILTGVRKLFDVGISVRSITCDGCITNIKTLELLGCHLDPENLVPFFKHPQQNRNIYCIMDPCHVLKLCRNAFAEINLCSSSGVISFDYIKHLHEVQQAEGFKFANSLSESHVRFQQKKMNVRLAAQVLSSSVADAIDFLRVSGNEKFANSSATSEFLRIVDRGFDIMNVRNVYGKGYKSPLTLKNLLYWQNIFKTTSCYIKDLKVIKENGTQQLLRHPRKTFALGFLINIISFEKLTLEFLNDLEHPHKYFLTYKCSQDHLELFFCCIRSRGGWNNNPNVLQFKWALRKLLFRNSVVPSVNGNCSVYNEPCTAPIFEFAMQEQPLPTNSSGQDDAINMMRSIDHVEFSYYKNNILYYISGFILKKVIKLLDCCYCIDILLESNNCIEHNYAMELNHFSNFTNFVSRGKLYFPSTAVFKIIQHAEKVFQIAKLNSAINKQNFISCAIIEMKSHFIPKMQELFVPAHPITSTCDPLHEVQLVTYLTKKYLELRIQTHSKQQTLEILGRRATIRQKLNKTVLFYNV